MDELWFMSSCVLETLPSFDSPDIDDDIGIESDLFSDFVRMMID